MTRKFLSGSRSRQMGFALFENLFLIVGFLFLVIFGLLQVDSFFFREYDHWSYNRILEGKPHSIRDFFGNFTSSGFMTSKGGTGVPSPAELPNLKMTPNTSTRKFIPGEPLGRLQIPALGLSVMVLEGTDRMTLNRAVGHISGTDLPGPLGNVGIAGHRDTFFRCLRKISKNDQIILSTPAGTYHYSVESTQIVSPSNAEPLDSTKEPVLTLVTCYPFYYIGPAPQRFVVKARLENPSKG